MLDEPFAQSDALAGGVIREELIRCGPSASGGPEPLGGVDMLSKADASRQILAAKRSKGVSFERLAEAAACHPVFVAAAVYGQASLSPEQAEAVTSLLGLEPEVSEALQEFPMKGSLEQTVPTDPLIYRFHEITQVYGTAMKAVIHEMFGDGIMSAIDFQIDIRRKEDPKGDRVVVTYDGKFLPYRKW